MDAASSDDSIDSGNDLAGDDRDGVGPVVEPGHHALDLGVAESSGEDSDEALVEQSAPSGKRTKPSSAAAGRPAPKRQKQRCPSAASAVAASGPVLTQADLDTAQRFMDDCKCPRDVGRVIDRFSTLSNIKAVEWMNWYSIMLVPTIREMLLEPEKDRKHHLREEHLELIILIQRLVTIVRGHTIQSSSLRHLHEDVVRKLLTKTAACFPHDSGCVSPNMHLALHLRAQIVDYGPPSGFWCMPYERVNGLLTRLPYSRSAPAISTAKRALQLIALSSHTTSGVAYGRSVDTVLPAPAGAGFAHALHTSRNNNGVQHVYAFTADADGRRAQQLLSGWRDGTLMHTVNGNESFPGWLLNSRRRDPIDVSLLDLPATGLEANRKAFATLSLSEKVLDDLLKISHVKLCLRSHYLEAYKVESLLPYVKNLPRPADMTEEKHAAGLDLLEGNTVGEHEREQALIHFGVQRWLDDETIFAPTVRIYDKLMFAGESFDSVLSGSDSNNSYVAVAFEVPNRNPDAVPKSYLWYGRVSYYVQHCFNQSEHTYAAVRYYLYVRPKLSVFEGMKARYTTGARGGANLPPVPLHSKISHSSFKRFPVISRTFHGPHALDLVPVHRLMHRWIPCPIDAQLQHACPVPTRIHM